MTAGDVVIVLLHKDGLMMCSSDSSYAFSNTYSNGALSANYKNRAKDAAKAFGFRDRFPVFGGRHQRHRCGQERLHFTQVCRRWKVLRVTGIAAQKDGILVSTFSDAYNNVRYYGEIKFAFPKSSVPPVDDFVKTVSEIMTVAPADDKGGQSDQAWPSRTRWPGRSARSGGCNRPRSSPASTAPMAAIPPPPPPADAPPPTIAIGQTKDQVTAAFGQPTRVAKLGSKEIYYYKDMKVTFTSGKVSNVE